MPTLTQVPFLAIVFGDEPPNSADSDELRRLYARELGPDGEFEIVHHRRYQRYRQAPTPSDEAVRRRVARGTKQVVVLLPISCDYQQGAVGLRRFTQPDAEFKAFFRP